MPSSQNQYEPIIDDNIAGIIDNERFHGGEVNWQRIRNFVDDTSIDELKDAWSYFQSYFQSHYSRKLKYARAYGYIRVSEQNLDEQERQLLERERFSFLYNNFSKEKRRKNVEKYRQIDPKFNQHFRKLCGPFARY